MRQYRRVVVAIAVTFLLTSVFYRYSGFLRPSSTLKETDRNLASQIDSITKYKYHGTIITNGTSTVAATATGTSSDGGNDAGLANGTAHNSTDHSPDNLQPLVWTSLRNGGDKKTCFFSAFFDERQAVRQRPAVFVLGYHLKSIKKIKLYFRFTFANTTSVCHKTPVKQIRSCSELLDRGKIANSHTYLYQLQCNKATGCREEDIPVSVAVSDNPSCTGASAEIPVLNRQLPEKINTKRFGVCVESPIYGNVSLQQIVEFIEMHRTMGVEIVNLYVMEMEDSLWQFLQEHYVKRGLLRLFRWKKVERWVPLHYFMQSLLFHDCLYRNMHRVKYMAVQDLDELILPMKHNSWGELLDFIGDQDKKFIYRFGNCFYINSTSDLHPEHKPCDGVQIPKYFHWTRRLNCLCNDKNREYRLKYIMQTELIIDMYVHWICDSTKGEDYYVPHSLAALAHYRNTVPAPCKTATEFTNDISALKHQSAVLNAMGQHMCVHA